MSISKSYQYQLCISMCVSTVSPVSLVLVSLQQSLTLLLTLVYISISLHWSPQSLSVSQLLSLSLLPLLVCISIIGLQSLSSLLGLPHSPTVSHAFFFTCVHIDWSPSLLGLSQCLSYFFLYSSTYPLVSTVSPVSLISLSLMAPP